MKKIIFLCLILLFTLNTYAFDKVRISGFATAAGGYITDKEVGANSLFPSPGHDGYADDKVEFQPDSLAGLQISSRIADDVSVTVQMVGRFENEGSAVQLEWAYINYDLTDDFTIQAGRFRPEVYLYSSTLDIGYTFLWITPPSEVYSQAPMTYTDGVNLLLDHTFSNDMTIEASVYGSNVKKDIFFRGAVFPSTFKNLIGANFTLSNEYFRLHAGYAQTQMSSTLNDISPAGAFLAGAGNLNNPGIDNVEGLKVDDARGEFAGIGLTIDIADIILIGEYATRNLANTLFREATKSYYGTLGYRIGDFTPHVTYAAVDTSFKNSNAPVFLVDPITGTPTPVGTVGLFRSGLATDSVTLTAGLRYEINSKTALKLEYQKLSKSPEEINLLDNTLAYEKTNADLYKIALSVIF
ncbi:hypothetical protein JHD50_03155 [Sulfurimonas sp. MAG313]|nr:hypothetical protein [Sulfurimonas sp. MAG313]MDF1880310.1 hypothetical protein [Sulfurimonas sp. MAG313]